VSTCECAVLLGAAGLAAGPQLARTRAAARIERCTLDERRRAGAHSPRGAKRVIQDHHPYDYLDHEVDGARLVMPKEQRPGGLLRRAHGVAQPTFANACGTTS